MGINSVDGRDVNICLKCEYLDICTALFEKVEMKIKWGDSIRQAFDEGTVCNVIGDLRRRDR